MQAHRLAMGRAGARWLVRAALAGAAVAACAPLPARAAEGGSSGAAAEVDALLARLAASPCSFARNGQWHGAREAAEHLAMKRGAAASGARSAEEFIASAASRSSQTGRPYAVRCPGEPEQPAGAWLQRQLEQMRSGRQ